MVSSRNSDMATLELLCLCPTYGRRKELLENSIACFLQQEYPADHRHLVIFDDLGNLAKTDTSILPGVTILSQTRRCASIAEKYQVMLKLIPLRMQVKYDAVVVWDDDDIYLPWHLSVYAAVLADHGWSKPSLVWSAYHNPLQIEAATGRFHGSLAIRRDLLDRIGGWVQTKRADFDQQMISRLAQEELPGNPCDPRYLSLPNSRILRYNTSACY